MFDTAFKLLAGVVSHYKPPTNNHKQKNQCDDGVTAGDRTGGDGVARDGKRGPTRNERDALAATSQDEDPVPSTTITVVTVTSR
jgi:hypothetical protein